MTSCLKSFPFANFMLWVGLTLGLMVADSAWGQTDFLDLDQEPELDQSYELDQISELDLVYEVVGQAKVKNENYVRARKRAVQYAFKNSMEIALQDMVGRSAYHSKQKALGKLVRRAEKYVKRYRFLEVEDNTIEKLSRVKLEVVLYKSALNRELSSLGVIPSNIKPRSVIILILESSLSSDIPAEFWDYVPIAEVALLQNFLSAGVTVVGRDVVRDLVDEQVVIEAARGNISAAVEIGMKAGADVVIVGSAISSREGDASTEGAIAIRANLNLKAISATQSVVVAAKSDFAVVKAFEEFNGELKAFEVVSKKIFGFMLGALNRYWEPEADPEALAKEAGGTPGPPATRPAPSMREGL